MFSKSVMSLTLSSIILLSVSDLALASGRGKSSSLTEEEGKSAKSNSFIRGLQKLTSNRRSSKSNLDTSSSHSSSSSPSSSSSSQRPANTDGESKDHCSPIKQLKNGESEESFQTPPLTANKEAVQKWINHYTQFPEAVNSIGIIFPKMLTTEEMKELINAGKSPENKNYKYVLIRGTTYGSLRTISHDSVWKDFIEKYPKLCAVIYDSQLRNVATKDALGTGKNKPAELVTYVLINLNKEGGYEAIINPDEKKAQTFSVNYRME